MMTIKEACLLYAQENLELDKHSLNMIDENLSQFHELKSLSSSVFTVSRQSLYYDLLYCYKDSGPETERQIDVIFGILTPNQKTVNEMFWQKYQQKPENATQYLYILSQLNNYIQVDKVKNNLQFNRDKVIVTINLSKEEKDNKVIREEAKKVTYDFPKCVLCYENVGYKGVGHQPPRSTLRVAEMLLDDDPWFMQYSPYPYFDEHAIFIDKTHRPMKVDHKAVKQLFDIVDLFPHYFVGSNAAMPIIGGSILSHAHFQGGKKQNFPLMLASEDEQVFSQTYKNITMHTLKWPSFTLRLVSSHRDQLIPCILEWMSLWEYFKAEEIGLIPQTQGEKHHGITPIIYKDKDVYVVHLIFRSNITSTEHVDGVFHAHSIHHHIKKEGIGLIEAMGMFILPGRLARLLEHYQSLTNRQAFYHLAKQYPIHEQWLLQTLLPVDFDSKKLQKRFIDELSQVCLQILSNISVFKKDCLGQAYQKQFLSSMK